MATASDFERIVRKHRRRQLTWTKTSVRRIDKILQHASADVLAKLREHAGGGTLQEKYLSALLTDISRVLDNLKGDYGDLMGLHLLGSAQIAADREARIAGGLFSTDDLEAATAGLHPSFTRAADIGGAGRVSVTYGLVAEDAVNAVYQRVYRDGLTLSDRLWRLDAGIRRAVEDRVVSAVAQGTSAQNLAKDLRQYLTSTGQGNARYNAMRLARTEINTAHREGGIRAVTKPDGTLRDHVQAIGWRLSMSHPEPDICDVWASQDIDGLGPGNYLPQNVPVDHPHGLCFIVSVLKAHPEMQHVTKEPEPDKVPDSEMRRYGLAGGEERVDVERLPKNPAAADREARQIASTPLERDTSKSQKPNLGA